MTPSFSLRAEIDGLMYPVAALIKVGKERTYILANKNHVIKNLIFHPLDLNIALKHSKLDESEAESKAKEV